jgi:hypothetical protein
VSQPPVFPPPVPPTSDPAQVAVVAEPIAEPVADSLIAGPALVAGGPAELLLSAPVSPPPAPQQPYSGPPAFAPPTSGAPAWTPPGTRPPSEPLPGSLPVGYPPVGIPPPGYPPVGYPGPFGPPPARGGQSTALRVALAVAVAVALLCGLVDTGLAVLRQAPTATFVGGTTQLRSAIQELLNRRAAAVNQHDEKAYLADVDTSRPTFVQHEKDEFVNIQALDLSAFTLSVTEVGKYPAGDVDPALNASFDNGLTSVAVTVKYAVRGLDESPVAAPWIPYVGQKNGRWVIADELTQGDKLPEGTGGLPWQTGPVVVKRSAHVVAVISRDDERIAPQLLDFAETGVSNALDFLPTGWPGKVLVTAVSDPQVIASYFRDDMEMLGNTAAVTVQAFAEVYEWRGSGSAHYVTSRVLFNPESLGGDPDELQMTLTHEFVHVATGPITYAATPTWLVEGIAEYVALDTGKVSNKELHAELEHYGYPTRLPDDDDFYQVGLPDYLYSALACRYIASTYGKDKLLAFYTAFAHTSHEDEAVRSTLGISDAQLTSGWLSFLHGLK